MSLSFLNIFQQGYFHRSFKFEVWFDENRVLDGQSLFAALSSLFELAFCFQLEYPETSQTVWNILQLFVMKYGDQDTGTLTKYRKETAKHKVQNYLAVIRDIDSL